jgi:hypothetical protein
VPVGKKGSAATSSLVGVLVEGAVQPFADGVVHAQVCVREPGRGEKALSGWWQHCSTTYSEAQKQTTSSDRVIALTLGVLGARRPP